MPNKQWDTSEIEYLKESYYEITNKDGNGVYLGKREHDETANSRSRNDFQRDYTRILYSSSFRRLQGKMQILGVEFDQFFRNRLTHSLEVSQIARSIAEKIGKTVSDNAYVKDIYVVEAAALAHDIGHPAFGHSGEYVLNELSGEQGFEANAQNFRVLRQLERKSPNYTGLNLTKRTLFALLKYNIQIGSSKPPKFLYPEDHEFFRSILDEGQGKIKHRTLDVQILDLADEVAYAVHDLEDALSMKYFNIDELEHEFKLIQCECGCAEADESNDNSCSEFLEKVVNEAKKHASATRKSSEEYTHLFKKELTSILINELINDIGVISVTEENRNKTGTTRDCELGFKTYGNLVGGLKTLTFKCVNRSDNVLLYEKRGEIIIKELFALFTDTEYNKDYYLLPPEYRPKSKESDELKRNVIDYIAGMMDSFAISQYEHYFGRGFSDICYKCDGKCQEAKQRRSFFGNIFRG